MRDLFRAAVELLFRQEADAAADHARRTEAIRRRSIRARIKAERLLELASPERLGSYGRVRLR